MHSLSALIIATAVSGCLSQMALPANSYSHEVAKYGESLVLPCNIVREGTLEKRLVQWRFYEVGSNQASTIYKDGDVLETFQASYSRGNINDSGSDSIIIKNLKHENCGKYVCSTIDGSPVIHNEVQVGAGELFCDSASTYANIGDFIVLKCEANVSANPGLRPTFQWGTYNTNLGQGSVEKKPSTGGPTKFISTYSLIAQTNTGPGYYCDLGFKYAGPVYDFASDSHKHVDTSSTYVYITMGYRALLKQHILPNFYSIKARRSIEYHNQEDRYTNVIISFCTFLVYAKPNSSEEDAIKKLSQIFMEHASLQQLNLMAKRDDRPLSIQQEMAFLAARYSQRKVSQELAESQKKLQRLG